MLTFDEIVDKIDQLEEANILLAALELKLFSILDKQALTADEVAQKADIDREATGPFLNALAAMGALRKTKDRFKNTSETYKHLCETSRHYKRGIVYLRGQNRDEWAGLLKTIQHGRDLSEFEGPDDPEFRRPFTHAMHERSTPYARRVAAVVTKRKVGNLLDLGAGPGTYSAEILKKDKKATATLLDRPATLEAAREILAADKVTKRIEFLEGDLFDTGYGTGRDTVLFSNILHIYNPQQNETLFKKIHQALNPGGRLFIVDLFLKENRTEPYDAALFALTMLLFTETGKSYTFRETETLLKDTGFGSFKTHRLTQGSSILEAVKK